LKLNREELTNSPDDPLALSGDVVGRVTEPVSDSEQSFARLKQWYHDCLGSHTECYLVRSLGLTMPTQVTKVEDGPLPTRLINIGSADGKQNPFLWECGGSEGCYAALSYCWGTSTPFTTQIGSYKDRLQGFALGELPKTVRDAVVITRILGLQFLWVDALCIIQGDPNDWQRESSKMDHIYGNASITIAATASKDSSDGCFVRRTTPLTNSVPLRSVCSNSDEAGTLFISEKLGSVHEILDRSPLNNRGWCLQERVISRRIIHFAQDQMYWECQKHCAAEDGTIIEDQNAPKRCLNFGELSFREPTFATVMRSWHTIVTEYSMRNLSWSSDKLPAISGLASQIAKRTGAEYLAGLWRQDLPFGLLWHASHGEGKRVTDKWRAPSWSWASIDGPVDSQGYRAHAILLDKILDKAVILSAVVHLAGENPFGEVTDGLITIRGRTKRARRASTKEQFDYGGWVGNVSYEFPILNDKGLAIGDVVFDYGLEKEPESFDCLLICKGHTKTGALRCYVLIIACASRMGHYMRIGAGYMTEDYFQSCDSRIITIV
jgi:hypothetical protein